MNPVHSFFLHAGFVGFSLVILAFLLFVPFYRTIIGCILFWVKVNFWLILFLAVLLQHGLDSQSTTAQTLRTILYPSTAITGFALFGVVVRAQYLNRKPRSLESALFNKERVPLRKR